MSGKRAKKDRASARATTGEDKLMLKARLIRERDERAAEARRGSG